MSQLARVRTDCPRCAAPIEGEIGIVISTLRTPEWRDRILDRSFNLLACEACGARPVVERTVAFLDFERLQWVHCFPGWAVAHWRDLARVAREQFRLTVVTHAPPMVRVDAPRWTVRAVFGYEAMREKLIVWDAELDERAVEGTKLALLAGHPQWFGATLALDAATDAGLRWVVRRTVGSDPEQVVAVVETSALTPMQPPSGNLGQLGDDPFWSYLRYLVEPRPADPLAFDLDSRRYGFGGGDMRVEQDDPNRL